ncbi:MAG: DUF192 domain-containing protein [Bdellovibrionales bacterium]|nr:DUF192 domain-containing protein [Bdellovibrionales bacterium]
MKKLIILNLVFIFINTLYALPAKEASPSTKSESEKKVSFRKGVVKIKGKKLLVEIAETDKQRAYGLMNRTNLEKNSGMLFIFPNEEIRFFWMKNTFVDLSIAYINKNKKIIDIQDMMAATSALDENLPAYPSKDKAMYALEVNKDWFKKNNIKVGNSLQEIKFLK